MASISFSQRRRSVGNREACVFWKRESYEKEHFLLQLSCKTVRRIRTARDWGAESPTSALSEKWFFIFVWQGETCSKKAGVLSENIFSTLHFKHNPFFEKITFTLSIHTYKTILTYSLSNNPLRESYLSWCNIKISASIDNRSKNKIDIIFCSAIL